MPTVIENRPATIEGSGAGALVATAVIIVLGILFFLYALPVLRGRDSGAQINIPDRVNVETNGQ